MSRNSISVEDAIHMMTSTPETFSSVVSWGTGHISSQSMDPWNYSLLLAYNEVDVNDRELETTLEEGTFRSFTLSSQGSEDESVQSGPSSFQPQLLQPGTGTPQHWTKEEHERFLSALEICRPKGMGEQPGFPREGAGSVGLGRGVAKEMAKLIGTRTASQVRSHAQKYFLKHRADS